MENGDDTFATPTAAAAHPSKPCDAAEIDALREGKRGLEEKLAAVTHENHSLAAEARRLEGLLLEAKDEITTAEKTTSTTKGKILSLRAEVQRLKGLLASEKSGREVEVRKVRGLKAQRQAAILEKVDLDKRIKCLKDAAAGKKEETAASSTVVPAVEMVVAAAAGAAATAAIAVVVLHLKR